MHAWPASREKNAAEDAYYAPEGRMPCMYCTVLYCTIPILPFSALKDILTKCLWDYSFKLSFRPKLRSAKAFKFFEIGIRKAKIFKI
jgi:hypothetical protein